MEINKLDQLISELEFSLQTSTDEGLAGVTQRPAMRYEQLVLWAVREFSRRNPGVDYVSIFSDADVAHNRVRERIKPGRKLANKTQYLGAQPLECPFAVPISQVLKLERRSVLTNSYGAFAFRFSRAGESFEVVYANARHDEEYGYTTAVAVLPRVMLQAWMSFEQAAVRTASSFERGQQVFVIGGKTTTFKPAVSWDQVILDEQVKEDLRQDVLSFFETGIDIYKKLHLPPFRKLLLIGQPGTGKTTITAALARLVLERKSAVIYISASDDDDADFSKVEHALRLASRQRCPVMIILEEIDVYLKDEAKSQILNVLDGMETPDNSRGALLVATTNYPEVIDERIAKRPGRIDRIIHIPPIQDRALAERMLKRYLVEHWAEEFDVLVPDLVGKTGAFVRELVLYARLLAANRGETSVSLELLNLSYRSLMGQVSSSLDLTPRRPLGFKPSDP
jgi:predicted AAA+ superfamily ATPase